SRQEGLWRSARLKCTIRSRGRPAPTWFQGGEIGRITPVQAPEPRISPITGLVSPSFTGSPVPNSIRSLPHLARLARCPRRKTRGRTPVVPRAFVVIGVAPRIQGHGLLQIGTIPTGHIPGVDLQRLESLPRHGVAPRVQLELVEGGPE